LPKSVLLPDEYPAEDLKKAIAALPVRNETRAWLCSMMRPGEMPLPVPPDFSPRFFKCCEEDTQIAREDPDGFKCWFLFRARELLECFDPKKVAQEKIACIPHLFKPAPDGKRGLLPKPWVSLILESIECYIEHEDATGEFGRAYRKILRELLEPIRRPWLNLPKEFPELLINEPGKAVLEDSFLESCERAVNETERIGLLNERCVAALRLLPLLVNEEFPAEPKIPQQKPLLYDAARFLAAHTSLWKGVKPLLTAFRIAKKPMISNILYCANPHTSANRAYGLPDGLPSEIASFFWIEDPAQLKQLRYDMANDFIAYLKPAKKPRRAEYYTKTEQQHEGFALAYTEPSPFWRYAYVRALGDLGVKKRTGTQGHYIGDVLLHTARQDPSQKVREAAGRVYDKLNNLRVWIELDTHRKEVVDHRKRLYEAFWWLREAHLLSLGEAVDKQYANEVRREEWRNIY